MQGDLIDRKELIKELRENIKIGFYGEFTDGSDVAFTIKELERVINEQPTAYDVEKLVEELEAEKYSTYERCVKGMFDAVFKDMVKRISNGERSRYEDSCKSKTERAKRMSIFRKDL